jgi:hypothetical protein
LLCFILSYSSFLSFPAAVSEPALSPLDRLDDIALPRAHLGGTEKKGGNRMTEVIKNIEAMHNFQMEYLQGYDLDDNFIDEDDDVCTELYCFVFYSLFSV